MSTEIREKLKKKLAGCKTDSERDAVLKTHEKFGGEAREEAVKLRATLTAKGGRNASPQTKAIATPATA